MTPSSSSPLDDASATRLVDGHSGPDEPTWERSLRPRRFAELIGQTDLVANLKVFVKAALERGEALDHLLLCGPPGLGKTTIAMLLAKELDVALHVTSGPAIERKDLAGIVSHLKERDVLFIDEIHRLSPLVEENLYPAMEDFKFDLVLGTGPQARTLEMPLPPFTLVGATTRSGLLTGPMRDRFGFTARFEYYSNAQLEEVVCRSASLLGIACEQAAAHEIARRSRGTPRIANRLLRRVRDFASVEGNGRIEMDVTTYGLQRLGIDPFGFDELDRRLLHMLLVKFSGGPVGLDTLSAALGEERETLESVVEPYLLQHGFLARTPRGRVATPQAYHFLGLAMPANLQPASL